MKLPAFIVFAAFVLATAPAPKEDPAKDPKALQGTWRHATIIGDGEIIPAQLFPNRRVVIEGNKVTEMDGGKMVSECIVELDPLKKPKVVDATPLGPKGPERAALCRGIYSLEGDTLKFCFGKPGGDRPGAFSSKKGSGRNLLILKREKP